MLRKRTAVLLLTFLGMSGCTLFPTGNDDEEEDQLRLLWKYEFDYSEKATPKVLPEIIDNHSIIVSGGHSVASLKVNDGTVIWEDRFGNDSYLNNSSFGVLNDQVMGTTRDEIFGWDSASGNRVWSFSIPDSLKWNFNVTRIGSHNDKHVMTGISREIYIITKDGQMIMENLEFINTGAVIDSDVTFLTQRKTGNHGLVSAYKGSSMELLWRFEPDNIGYRITFAPVLSGDVLYVFFSGANYREPGIFALNAHTGEEIWQKDVAFSYAILEGDKIFGITSSIWCLDKNTGEMIWKTYNSSSSFNNKTLDYLNGYLYTSTTREIQVLDAETGEIVYQMPHPNDSDKYSNIISIKTGAGRVFVQSYYYLYAFAPWGHELSFNDEHRRLLPL